MERVTFLVEDTHERITALLNPASVVSRRNSIVRERRSLPTSHSAGLFDHGPVVSGGGVTEIELDLLFDTSIPGSSVDADDVRALTEPLWKLADARTNASLVELPQLRFIWGKACNIPAVVVAVAERLEHFDANGAARRSWLRLRLRRVPERIEPSVPGVPKGMPAARTFAKTDSLAIAKSTNNLAKDDLIKSATESSVADIVAAAIATPEAKQLAEQTDAALGAAENALVESGLTLSFDMSIVTNSFAFEMSLEVDLSALTPSAIAARVGGWIRWARDGIRSLGVAAKRLGQAAIRQIRSGIERMGQRIVQWYESLDPKVREQFAAIVAAVENAGHRIAAMSRVVFAEAKRRILEGYRALARETTRAVQSIERHAKAIKRAIIRIAITARDVICGAIDSFIIATQAVATAVIETGLKSARAVGQLVASAANTVAHAAASIGSTIRTTVASALHAAATARDAVVKLLTELAPQVLKWAHDTLVRSVSALGEVARATTIALEKSALFVADSAASALGFALSRAQALLANSTMPAHPSVASQLTEAAASDEIASDEATTVAIRARVALIVPRIAWVEQGHTPPNVAALRKDISILANDVAEQDAEHVTNVIDTLARKLPPTTSHGHARLDLLAYEYGGDPRAWKLIAEKNGIDNPLAVSANADIEVSFLSTAIVR